jgi:hypothetical protein
VKIKLKLPKVDNGLCLNFSVGAFLIAGSLYGFASTRVISLWPDNIEPRADLTNAIAVFDSDGGHDRLALLSDGTITSWGALTVPGRLSNVVSVACGELHNLELQSDGKVGAWGEDLNGDAVVPPGLSQIIAIAAGYDFSLALRSDGTIACWGEMASWPIPSGLSNVIAIAAGWSHALALQADGKIVAWGLGEQATVPSNLSNVVRIAAGSHHSLALKEDGTLVAWGSYGNRTLLLGEYAVPAALPSDATNVAAMIGGEYHTLALKRDGTIVQWGAVGPSVSFIPAGASSYQGITIPNGLTNVMAISHGLALIGDVPPMGRALLENPTLNVKGFSCSVPTQSGRVYRLEYADRPTGSSWTSLPLIAGNGDLQTLNDPSVAATQRFYRVRAW